MGHYLSYYIGAYLEVQTISRVEDVRETSYTCKNNDPCDQKDKFCRHCGEEVFEITEIKTVFKPVRHISNLLGNDYEWEVDITDITPYPVLPNKLIIISNSHRIKGGFQSLEDADGEGLYELDENTIYKLKKDFNNGIGNYIDKLTKHELVSSLEIKFGVVVTMY